MANHTDLDALLQQVPVDDLARRFGVDEATVQQAVQQALPGLIGGMAVNASDADGARRLAAAAQRHEPQGGRLKLEAIDEADGEKIVGHVLGDKRQDVAHALGRNAGDSTIASLIPQLLPVLAPIVMQFISGRLGGNASSTVATTADDGAAGGLGDLLGGLLGGLVGGSGSASGAQSSGGLGDLLGGLLGGGSGAAKSSGGGLGGLLGGLLGK